MIGLAKFRLGAKNVRYPETFADTLDRMLGIKVTSMA